MVYKHAIFQCSYRTIVLATEVCAVHGEVEMSWKRYFLNSSLSEQVLWQNALVQFSLSFRCKGNV